MNSEKYSKKVNLRCPTCGNTQFEFDNKKDSNVKSIRCPSCNREFSKDELIRENREIIDANVGAIKQQVIKDIKKGFKNIFKKFK